MSLADLTIKLYRKGTPALDAVTCADLLKQVPQWSVVNVNGIAQLQRHFDFHDFAEALAFTNAVGALADTADHHPAITTEWGKVQVCWWTHTVRGLHRNDFVMAARCDRLYLAKADR